jgi:hypothetical protein
VRASKIARRRSPHLRGPAARPALAAFRFAPLRSRLSPPLFLSASFIVPCPRSIRSFAWFFSLALFGGEVGRVTRSPTTTSATLAHNSNGVILDFGVNSAQLPPPPMKVPSPCGEAW